MVYRHPLSSIQHPLEDPGTHIRNIHIQVGGSFVLKSFVRLAARVAARASHVAVERFGKLAKSFLFCPLSNPWDVMGWQNHGPRVVMRRVRCFNWRGQDCQGKYSYSLGNKHPIGDRTYFI